MAGLAKRNIDYYDITITKDDIERCGSVIDAIFKIGTISDFLCLEFLEKDWYEKEFSDWVARMIWRGAKDIEYYYKGKASGIKINETAENIKYIIEALIARDMVEKKSYNLDYYKKFKYIVAIIGTPGLDPKFCVSVPVRGIL